MSPTLATIVRHPDENLAKCTLEPLRSRKELSFLQFSASLKIEASGAIVLSVDAPLISEADAGSPLILLDGNWKHVPKLKSCLTGTPIYRSLPKMPTAYPRRNDEGLDPPEGLASVEALYLALKLLGHDDPSLLSQYHWREEFLKSVALFKI
jgi:pre-rRNA-processing protein TSR3